MPLTGFSIKEIQILYREFDSVYFSLNSSGFYLRKQASKQILRLLNICPVPRDSDPYGEWFIIAVHLFLNEWLLLSVQQLEIKNKIATRREMVDHQIRHLYH